MQRRMTRIYVLSAQGPLRELVRALQKLGVLHLEPVALSDPPYELATERHELEELLLKVRGLRDVLPQGKEQQPQAHQRLDLSEVRERVRTLEEQVRPLVAERRTLQERLDAATRLQDVLEATEALLGELGEKPGRSYLVGLGSREISWEEIAQFLQTELAGRCTVRARALPHDRWESIVSVDAEYAPAVREYLEAKGVRPLALPSHIPSTMPLAEAIAQLKRDLAECPARLHELDRKLRELAQLHGMELRALERALANRIAQLDAM
ncbi:MAG: hypothetical protein ACK4HB_08060, partial [Candidatus Bipolaricaulia bacterium]